MYFPSKTTVVSETNTILNKLWPISLKQSWLPIFTLAPSHPLCVTTYKSVDADRLFECLQRALAYLGVDNEPNKLIGLDICSEYAHSHDAQSLCELMTMIESQSRKGNWVFSPPWGSK